MEINDLYKLENGGVYFLRIDAYEFTQEQLDELYEITKVLHNQNNIKVVIVEVPSGALEFIPKKTGEKIKKRYGKGSI